MSAARNYPSEMMTGINQLKEMLDNVSSQIDAEKAIYNKLKDEIATLNERLAKSQANLDVLLESRDAYTKSVEECELVYNKINESSQNLLNVIMRDTKSIQKNFKARKYP
ncbi:hypothetical protein ACHAW5_001583 [Stephanodiscus triporus]|uniref:Uncharacterized protein n=1 Tax=Stephanodiscus triporus TaxID=2934178 RepID=A0ABD3NI58_9STRA